MNLSVLSLTRATHEPEMPCKTSAQQSEEHPRGGDGTSDGTSCGCCPLVLSKRV